MPWFSCIVNALCTAMLLLTKVAQQGFKSSNVVGHFNFIGLLYIPQIPTGYRSDWANQRVHPVNVINDFVEHARPTSFAQSSDQKFA